jgi:hypothetical protein
LIANYGGCGNFIIIVIIVVPISELLSIVTKQFTLFGTVEVGECGGVGSNSGEPVVEDDVVLWGGGSGAEV